MKHKGKWKQNFGIIISYEVKFTTFIKLINLSLLLKLKFIKVGQFRWIIKN